MEGLLALAVAMGIGRFAFTPILPMMLADADITVAQGGWLASANYVGYLAGALTAMSLRLAPGFVVRASLAAVGIATLAMAFTESFAAWMALRFAAGAASAWVLVFVSSWGFQRPEVVFSGVGFGIAAAGLMCLVLMAANAESNAAWVALGAIAIVSTLAMARGFRGHAAATPGARVPFQWTPEARRLVACYGAFGFGYIIPATFLPAMAKQAIGDPLLFGWSWPVFGAAAAASTLLAGRLRGRLGDRAIWAVGHVAMAVGVVLLIVPKAPAAVAITLCALLVGGTFMVITMAGVQEARRLAGSGARTLIAAMTSAFAAGQIAGPMLVSVIDSFVISLALAAALLLASAFTLRRTHERSHAPAR